jgi:hypothetical protein
LQDDRQPGPPPKIQIVLLHRLQPLVEQRIEDPLRQRSPIENDFGL